MILACEHEALGLGVLSTEHSSNSYGQPVFVRDLDGEVFGAGD